MNAEVVPDILKQIHEEFSPFVYGLGIKHIG